MVWNTRLAQLPGLGRSKSGVPSQATQLHLQKTGSWVMCSINCVRNSSGRSSGIKWSPPLNSTNSFRGALTCSKYAQAYCENRQDGNRKQTCLCDPEIPPFHRRAAMVGILLRKLGNFI